jgi:hypothetical protein
VWDWGGNGCLRFTSEQQPMGFVAENLVILQALLQQLPSTVDKIWPVTPALSLELLRTCSVSLLLTMGSSQAGTAL